MRHLNAVFALASPMVVLLSALTLPSFAQSTQTALAHSTPVAATAPTVVPALVRCTGAALLSNGKPQSGESSVTFLIYRDAQGGEPLWVETQMVAFDPTGHYEVNLGAMNPSGLPTELFASGEARWLEVQIAGGSAQARILLATVPYAMKAADAATLGGLPASAFALAASHASVLPVTGAPASVTPNTTSPVTTMGGTAPYVPVFSGANTIVNSEIYDNGTSVGIGGIPASGSKLNVIGVTTLTGATTFGGATTLLRSGTATSAKGYPSYPLGFYSHAYNSSSKADDFPIFYLQSEPTGNNTASTGATFNLLYANHGATPAETGLSINSTGIIKFAHGQTFPSSSSGSGAGAITGVTASSPLTGGGTSGNVIVGLNLALLETSLNPYYASLTSANNFTSGATFAGTINGNSGVMVHSGPLGAPGNAYYDDAAILGTYGGASAVSQQILNDTSYFPGVWGDAHNIPGQAVGVMGTADDSNAGYFGNNSIYAPTITAYNEGSGTGTLFRTFEADSNDGTCGIGGGNLTCTGQMVSLATTASGQHTVETYAMHSPEDWMEDFGASELHGGSGIVTIDPVFADTVSKSTNYHVFLTPRGDSKGLYVANVSATSFEVRESGGGTASIGFDYRIVAKRRGYEAARLTDVTKTFKAEMLMAPHAQTAAHRAGAALSATHRSRSN